MNTNLKTACEEFECKLVDDIESFAKKLAGGPLDAKGRNLRMYEDAGMAAAPGAPLANPAPANPFAGEENRRAEAATRNTGSGAAASKPVAPASTTDANGVRQGAVQFGTWKPKTQNEANQYEAQTANSSAISGATP